MRWEYWVLGLSLSQYSIRTIPILFKKQILQQKINNMSDFKSRLFLLQWMSNDGEKARQSEAMIKEAQQLNDIELEYQARCIYMQAIAFNEEPEKVLACFPWLLAMNDKHPEKFDLWEVLWYYKWVVGRVAKFPSITKERIMNIMADMERRYVAAGYGRKTVLYFLRQIHQDFGEPELAEKAHQEYLELEENSTMSDCTACVINTMVSYERWKGNYELAIEKAQDLLNRKHSCAEVPLRTYEKVLRCYSELNKLDEGLAVYHEANKKLGHKRAMLTDYGNIIIYLTLTQNDVKAKTAFTKQLPYALTFDCEYNVQDFYIGVLFFLTALQNKKKKDISLPKSIELPIPHEDRKYLISDLIKFFESEIDRIAQLFNKRNGNDFYSHKKEQTMSLLANRRKVKLV